MKQTIFYLVFIFLILPDLQAQTFAASTQYANEFTFYSQSNFVMHRKHPPKPGALTIIGGSSICIGVPLAVWGLLVEYDAYSAANETTNQSQWQRGNREVFAGCAIIISGIGMCIAGGIHDHKKHHQNRWGISIPKKNEIGFAYNF